MIATLSAEGKMTVFHSCHADRNPGKARTGFILSSLLHRLIALKPDMLRHRMKDLRNKIQSAEWTSPNSTIYCFDVLKGVIESFPKESEIYVVLDRMDLCNESKGRFILALERLIEGSPITLKVILVMERISEDSDREFCRELLSSEARCTVYGDLDWDQTRKS